jgi:hypothetical protein
LLSSIDGSGHPLSLPPYFAVLAYNLQRVMKILGRPLESPPQAKAFSLEQQRTSARPARAATLTRRMPHRDNGAYVDSAPVEAMRTHVGQNSRRLQLRASSLRHAGAALATKAAAARLVEGERAALSALTPVDQAMLVELLHKIALARGLAS